MENKAVTLALLRAGRERLSKIENWCSKGDSNPEGTQYCAVLTLHKVEGEFDYWQRVAACHTLTNTFYKIYPFTEAGGYWSIIALNDGDKASPWGMLSVEERWKKILEVYDKAIESMAKETA